MPRSIPRWPLLVLACALLALGSASAKESPRYRGRLLREVLQELRAGGIDLIFSSAVVSADLRVTVEPAGPTPRAILDAILAPLDLVARDGPAGSIAILPREGGVEILSGQVLAARGRAPIAGALVRVAGTGATVRTGPDGTFELRGVPPGSHELIVVAPGYSTATVAKRRTRRRAGAPPLTVLLAPQSSVTTAIVVRPSHLSVLRLEQGTAQVVENEDALLVPTIGADISRVAELLPGVAAGDNSAAFHVRGSETADVAIVLDGLELYDPFHLQSFQSPFSLIDSSIVDRIDLFGGTVTVDRGDRHGAFVEISTLTSGETVGGEVELGTLNSRGSYHAPLPGNAGSWLASVRAWYPDALRDTVELGGGERNDPRFGDAYVKASLGVSPRTLLSAYGLLAYDRLRFAEHGEGAESADAITRNGYLWLRALNAWSATLSSESVLSGGRIDRLRQGVSVPEDDEAVVVDDQRAVDFLGLRNDTTWQISSAHVLRAGIDVRRLHGRYRYTRSASDEGPPPAAIALDPDGTSIAAFIAHRARWTSSFAAELGLRWDRQTYTGDNQLSPRLNAVWRAGERSEVRFGLGRVGQSQRIHELHVEDGETTFLPAEASEQAELTFQHAFPGGLRVRLDAYDRRLSHLRPRYENLFEPIELFPETAADRVRLLPARARLRGVELLLRGDAAHPLSWSVSYARSAAEDTIDGRDVPRSWDQPHALKGLIGYRWEDRWSVSLAGTAHTGWPTTPVTGVSTPLPDGTTRIDPVLGPRNSTRFPWYVRLDAKARRSFQLERGRIGLTLEVVNLTDRDNACCVDELLFEAEPDGTVTVERDLDHWLGITPSFNVSWEF